MKLSLNRTNGTTGKHGVQFPREVYHGAVWVEHGNLFVLYQNVGHRVIWDRASGRYVLAV